MSLTAKCHCGDITVTVPRKPEWINICQCTLCRSYGVEWGYYEQHETQIEKRDGGETRKYVWGKKLLEFHFCGRCGCSMYWWPIDPMKTDPPNTEMGLNTRMIDPEDLKKVEKRIMYDEVD